MSLQIRYNRISTAGGVDPDHITARQGVSFSSAAEEGSVAQTGMIVDDTANALDYVGLRRVYAFETAAPAHNQIVWNGYLQERRIGRDPAEGQDSDVEIMGRRWDLAIADTNSLLSRRLITGADGDRGAETDIARIQWLLDSNDKYLSNPQDVWANPSAYIDTTGPIAMDASDLRGQTAFDVLNDCAQRSGKNWFAVYDEATDTVPPTNAGKYTLHYYKPESTYYTSTLRLTNVNADADNVTTFYVLPDAILTRDPGRTYSGIYLTYDGGSLYQQSTDVANLFQRRDAAVSNPNVKTAAKATALATRYLVDAETEDDRLICRFVVAKQYVNSLREGQRFQAKFSHLPGYSSAYAYLRCLRRTVTQLNDEFYEIAIEATPDVASFGFTGVAYATLILSGETASVLKWACTGDAPCLGWYYQPIIGPLAYVESAEPFNGIRCLDLMTVNVACNAEFAGVWDGDVSFDLHIQKNGATIASGNYSSSGGLRYIASHISATATSVSVSSGDVFTATGSLIRWDNAGANATYLRVSRP